MKIFKIYRFFCKQFSEKLWKMVPNLNKICRICLALGSRSIFSDSGNINASNSESNSSDVMKKSDSMSLDKIAAKLRFVTLMKVSFFVDFCANYLLHFPWVLLYLECFSFPFHLVFTSSCSCSPILQLQDRKFVLFKLSIRYFLSVAIFFCERKVFYKNCMHQPCIELFLYNFTLYYGNMRRYKATNTTQSEMKL